MARLSGRQLWFQLHKWIALILLVLLIPVALSGSLLVWDDWTDSVVNPQRYAVTAGDARLPAGRYVDAARTVLKPGERIASLDIPAERGKPVILAAAPARAEGARRGPPLRHQIWLDPATARVLDQSSGGGFLRFVHVLHGSLLVPGVGRTIVGWVGVAMLILSLTGIWLWAPTAGRLTRGLRWRRSPSFSNNLHHQIGFWISVPLAILSFTGVWISFPGLFGGRGEAGGGPARARAFAALVASPLQSVDAVIAAAQARAGAARIVTVRWPTEADASWTVVAAQGDARSAWAVDDGGGQARPAPDRVRRPAGLMRILHDGTGTGPVWQTIIFLGGLAPAVLGVTGLVMWLKTRGWRRRLRERQAARRTVSAG